MKKHDPFKVYGGRVAPRRPSEERKRVVLKPRVRPAGGVRVIISGWSLLIIILIGRSP